MDIIIDLDRVRSELGAIGSDGDQFLGELYHIFATRAPAVYAKSDVNIRRQNLAGLKSDLHLLKGMAGNVGASALRQMCLEMEAAADSGDIDKLEESKQKYLEVWELTYQRAVELAHEFGTPLHSP